MTDWTDGYHADSEYVADFFKELAPSYLDFICIINKVAPPPSSAAYKKNFRYCELGAGNGVTTNILAASYPDAEFHAIDFMPVHIANARHLADQAELKNIFFHETSFQEADKLNLGEFDYIVLHGVYSWISAENRQAVMKFVKSHLKTGGIVYNSYNTMPGWSHVLPFREAMTAMGDSQAAHTAGKVQIARNFINKLKEKNAAFIRLNPQIEQQIKELDNYKVQYLAQEYLNQDWNPLYVTDVLKEAKSAKLTYVGSATLHENYNQYQFTQEQIELIAEQPTSDMQEFTKDLLINKKFRRDVYSRGARTLTATEQSELLKQVSFMLLRKPEDIELKVNIGVGEITLVESRALAVVGAMKQGPTDVESIVKNTDIALSDVLSVVAVLLISNQAMLVHPGASQQSIQKINEAIGNRAFSDQALNFFAYYGTGIGVNPEDQMLLKHSEKLTGKRLVDKIISEMKQNNRAFMREGKVLQEEAEVADHTEKLVKEFEDNKKPLFDRLGLVKAKAGKTPEPID